ncbi:glycine-rich protein [Leucobacter sp. VD1]|uniref:glycine-rich protein n=1 Tax=Leucobacter sp. VD1 TaxID=3080381 RepID=UPI00301699B6
MGVSKKSIFAMVAVSAIAVFGLGSATLAVSPASATPPEPAPVCVPEPNGEQLRCSVSYVFTGAPQTFTVPANVTSVDLELVGGNGGGQWANTDPTLIGSGARVTGTLPGLVAGETLTVVVGGNGRVKTHSSQTENSGYNGGGNGTGLWWVAGGGGATDVRQYGNNLLARVAVAGGGGGGVMTDASARVIASGGDAGEAGSVPQAGCDAAQPGTSAVGGSGGTCGSATPGTAGTLGVGGNGGDRQGAGNYLGGGGGGGGYYGGGGGVGAINGQSFNGSGAGGSSLVPAGGSVAPSGRAAPSATVSYLIDIGTITVTSVATTALTQAAFSASTTGPSSETIDLTSLMSVTGAGLSCTGNACTAALAGSFPVSITFGTGSRSATSTFTASKVAQTIAFSGGSFTAGTPYALNGSATSGLGLSYAVRSGSCTVSGGVLTASAGGTCEVEATQAGNGTYLAATPVAASFTVAPAPKPAPKPEPTPSDPKAGPAGQQGVLAKTGVEAATPALLGGALALLVGGAALLIRRARRSA